MPNALVLISDEEQRQMVAEHLWDTRSGWRVEQARHAASVKERLEQGMAYDLIVVHLEIDADAATPYREGQFNGLRFVNWLTGRANQTPVIVIIRRVGQEEDLRFDVVRDRPGAQCIAEGVALDKALDQAVEKALHAAERPVRPFATIEINAGETSNDWSWTIHGDYYDPGDKLVLSQERIDELIQESARVRNSMINAPERRDGDPPPSWVDELRALGVKLMQYLLRDNPDFNGSYCVARDRVGRERENLKVCFVANGVANDICIESICDWKQPNEFWMLSSPIYRDVAKEIQTRRPLFECQGRNGKELVNCLLIEADASGMADIGGANQVALPVLGWTKKNSPCEEIYQCLKQNKKALGIGDILTLSKSTLQAGEDFRSHLAGVLQRCEWHLIHYAGHSYYDPTQQTGFLFFPHRTKGGAPVAMSIEQFAKQCKTARFMYLSCCTSGQAKNLVVLAEWQVPAMLGFVSRVFNEQAKVFARTFYEKIARNAQYHHESGATCLQHAFVATRKALRDEYGDDDTWAQAVLMCRTRYA